MVLTNADRSFQVGDEAADALIEYAAAVGRVHTSGVARVTAISTAGHEVQVTFLFNSGTALVAESANSGLPEPDNTAAVEEIREKIRGLLATERPDEE